MSSDDNECMSDVLDLTNVRTVPDQIELVRLGSLEPGDEVLACGRVLKVQTWERDERKCVAVCRDEHDTIHVLSGWPGNRLIRADDRGYMTVYGTEWDGKREHDWA